MDTPIEGKFGARDVLLQEVLPIANECVDPIAREAVRSLGPNNKTVALMPLKEKIQEAVQAYAEYITGIAILTESEVAEKNKAIHDYVKAPTISERILHRYEKEVKNSVSALTGYKFPSHSLGG